MSNELTGIKVSMTNNFPFAVDSITLIFSVSGDSTPETSKTWNHVLANLTVEYEFELYTPARYDVICQVILPDGNTFASNESQSVQVYGGGSLLCSVSAFGFTLVMPPFDATIPMYGPNGANALAAIEIDNNFPVEAGVRLSHQFYNGTIKMPAASYTWSGISPGSNSGSEYFIVYFNYSDINNNSKQTDYWNIEIVLDVPPYEDQPEKAFYPWKNATPDLAWPLGGADVNKILTFSIQGAGWKLERKSKPAADLLTTPNGYNTTAFIKIENNFSSDIRKVVLHHQYSSDAKYEQIRTNIPAYEASDVLMFAEYLTGYSHPGSDYWNIEVYLTDGSYYKNTTKNKSCYMTEKDTTSVQNFGVSSSTFSLGLASGSCSDGMKYVRRTDYSLGIDISKPYNENAYLATHNAYANFEDGFWYAQQSMNLDSQLSMGVSCLLLDIWDYNGNVCLVHETTWMQPFGAPATLQQGLESVAAYLALEPSAVITIIFEDHVVENRSRIEQAFQNTFVGSTSLWSMVFFADQYDVNANGWPTLQWLIDNKTPLVVFSSIENPFPRQWDYMSENVYGDSSLDEATWLGPRKESKTLDQLPLCALNHFPTWAPSATTTWLTQWLGQISTTNKRDTALSMFYECQSTWGRLPNFWQVDFFELPDEEPASAVAQLNAILHGTTAAEPVSVRHGVIVPSDLDDDADEAGSTADDYGCPSCKQIDDQ